ncbi:MAG TPA: DinB family protein [Flavitalea sp.]|nr:DinB family protein [Flavitalea sp.]
MDFIPLLMKEFDSEAVITRKFLKIVPADKFNWKPHEKSMSMQNLAVHIAELPSWVSMGLHTDGIDFATMDYTPTVVGSNAQLVELFEKSYKSGREALSAAKEADLWPSWTMRMGERVISVLTKYEVIRHAFSQVTHHRAQLGVYLRLLHIPIPGSYGPSADETNF